MNKIFSKTNFKNIAIILMIAIFFIVDRYLKHLALLSSKPTGLIGDWLTFAFTPNYFIAFSLPVSGLILKLAIFLLIVSLAVLFFYLLIKKTKAILTLGLSAVLLGALSNFIDRIRFDYVIDYLYLKHFTVFNFADALIVFGSIAIFLSFNKKMNR